LLHNGDSLAVGTQIYLPRALRGWRIRASVDISRHAPEGPRIMRRFGSRLPRVIVVSLGTNDDPRALAAFRGAIRATMRVAGRRRCVVWANIVRPPVGGAGYGGLNRVLAQEARARRNLRVFQWGRMARAHRGWFGPDRVHPSGVGYQARARGIAQVVRRCH
jgi:lysophospholipase L1-like esterase